MSGYLSLVLTSPRPRSLLRPQSLFSLGHVEIVLGQEGQAPKCYGYYVSPSTWPWIALSVLWPQKGRLIRSAGGIPRGARCRTWLLSPGQFQELEEYLERVAEDCRTGRRRYNALRANCFHLAFECLEAAGHRRERRTREWILFVPTIGSKSFARDVMDQGQDLPGSEHGCYEANSSGVGGVTPR
jgi:hypothetical protein